MAQRTEGNPKTRKIKRNNSIIVTNTSSRSLKSGKTNPHLQLLCLDYLDFSQRSLQPPLRRQSKAFEIMVVSGRVNIHRDKARGHAQPVFPHDGPLSYFWQKKEMTMGTSNVHVSATSARATVHTQHGSSVLVSSCTYHAIAMAA